MEEYRQVYVLVILSPIFGAFLFIIIYYIYIMASTDLIDLAYSLLKRRSNQRGATGNISPKQFNEFWNRAELKFFNIQYEKYAATQTISDAISKWMSDPIFIPIDATGRYNWFTGMNLIHVDSLSSFLAATGTTGQINGFTITGGTGYTDGNYTVTLTGGSGTGASANIIVSGGAVTSVVLTSVGSGFTVGNTLTGTVAGGSDWHITVIGIGQNIPQQMRRIEKEFLPASLSSTYDSPTPDFPIYTQYFNWFQFYPIGTGLAQLIYLQQPVYSVWGYTLQGYISTLSGLVGGTGYVDGTYNNVPLTGGLGSGALATIVVSGGAVTSVTVTAQGTLYATNDVLSASNTFLGGTGSGFSIIVTSILNPRPIYDPAKSINPRWDDNDISTIVDMALSDIAISNRDPELMQFAEGSQERVQ